MVSNWGYFTATVVIVNADFIDVHISVDRTKKHCILYSLL